MAGLYLAVAACSSGSDSGNQSGTIDVSADCAAACGAAAQQCGWSSTQQSDCSTGCSNEFAGLSSACASQESAAFGCAKQGATWDCASSKPTSCNTQLDALDACAKQHAPVLNLGPYCDKCASCISDPNFSEGFCDPFINGTTFDLNACSANGDPAAIDNKTLTAGQLSGMSCTDYDNAI